MKFRRCLIAAVLLGYSSSMATTLTIKGPLTEQSAYHMHEVFVQNSGAKLDRVPYTGYTVSLGYVENVAEKDAEHMATVVDKWLQAHGQQIRGLKFRVDRAETDSKRVMITGEHLTNDFFRLRDGLRQAVESANPPSGRHYTLVLNQQGIFVPSVYVGDIQGFPPRKVVKTINRRIEQSHIIHKCSYFEVEVDGLRLYRG
jgi:hypothetical protein